MMAENSRNSLAIGLLFSVLAFSLILSSSWNSSPCFDEPEHITAGFTYVGFGYHFMNPFHPPLVKDLAGLSVQSLIDPPALKSWWARDAAHCIEEMFSGDYVDVQRLTRVARLPIIILSSCFVGVFFLTVSLSCGRKTALLAATLLLISPTYLAHAAFVHTDAGAAGMCFLSLWFLARYLKHPPSIKRVLAFALVSGTAILVKFSCLVLAPVYLVAVSVVKDRRERLKQVPVVVLFILALVWIVYRVHVNSAFRHSSYLRYHFRSVDHGVVGLVHDASTTRLAPLARYVTGVLVQGRQVGSGHDMPGFVGGQVYYGRHWSFFPVVVLTKIPIGIWCLGCLALWRLRHRMDLELKLYLGFILLYSLVALTASINIGIRHLLPLLPPVFVLTACGLEAGLEHSRKGLFRWVVALAFVIALLGSLSSWPHYIRFFNLFSMGRIPVVDSNYDWGTDLHRFAQRAESQGWAPLYLDYFGGALPKAYLGDRYHKLDHDDLPKEGWVAISESHYVPLTQGDPSGLPSQERERREHLRQWFEGLTEVETAGTFRVFKI